MLQFVDGFVLQAAVRMLLSSAVLHCPHAALCFDERARKWRAQYHADL